MERRLEIYQFPNLFDQSVNITVTFDGVEFGSDRAACDEEIESTRDRLLCHLVKHTIGEILKSINLNAATAEQREACAQLSGALHGFTSGGDLLATKQFVDDLSVHIRAIVPPPNHRLYRSCRLKTGFLFAVGDYAPARSQAAGAS